MPYTRQEWEAVKASFPPQYRYQFWPMPWGIATWKERGLLVLTYAGMLIAGLIGFLAVMWLLASMVDVASQRNVDHDRCLKHATDGYEIRKCN